MGENIEPRNQEKQTRSKLGKTVARKTVESSRKCNQGETMRNAAENNSYKKQRMERGYLGKECCIHTGRRGIIFLMALSI